MNIAPGCPIVDSENKIIGITTNNRHCYPDKGKFLYKPVEDFYIDYYNKNFKVNFYVSFLNREYIVNAEDKYMFGELIVFFYFESGLDFDENISFFYNNREIPYFSSENLFNLNIKANSKIYVIKKNSDFFNEKIINLIIKNVHSGQSHVLHANPDMTAKEFILKFCQYIRYPFIEFIDNCRLTFNGRKIAPNEYSIMSFGLSEGSNIYLYNFEGI